MTDVLKIRPAADVKWDCVSFGEVMLRFDPGFGILGRQVHRDGVVASRFELWDEQIPTGGAVERAVHQGEGGHGTRSLRSRA